MPETNFLSSIEQPENNPPAGAEKLKGKRQKRILKSRPKAAEKAVDKSFFKLKENSKIKPAMPKAKLKIEENLSNAKKKSLPAQAGEAKNIYPARNNISNLVYRKIAFSFVVLTVILVAAVLYFGFSKVTLVIIPAQEKITDSLSLEVVDKANNSAMSQGKIQGVVRQVPVEQVKTFTASGKEILGEEVSGKVTIINNYMKNQSLVATTRLLAPGNKLFRLKNTVNVPAGGRVEVEVYADEPRSEMAIGPSKFTIPGLWAGIQDKIYAESQAPMEYSKKIKYVIKQNDLDSAVDELKKDLLVNAKKEIALAYAEYDQSILQADNNSVKLEVQGKVGEEKEKFSIKIKTMVTVAAFKGDDAYKQAQEKLTAALADDREIVELSQSGMTYALSDLNLSQAVATINVNFTAKVTLKDSTGIIKKNNLTGLSVEQARAYLSNLPEVAGYEIKFFPSFIRKMPNLVDRIEIVIKK